MLTGPIANRGTFERLFNVSDPETSSRSAFHRRFVTMRTLSAETGRAIPGLRVQLKRAGVALFSPDGQDFGHLYLREEVEAALERAKERKI